MEHLLTIARDEWGGRLRGIPEDRDKTFAGEHYDASFTSGRPSTPQDALAPHAIQLSDIGSMYPFTCTTWIAPGTLEALIPGRMQGHGGTEEVPR